MCGVLIRPAWLGAVPYLRRCLYNEFADVIGKQASCTGNGIGKIMRWEYSTCGLLGAQDAVLELYY